MGEEFMTEPLMNQTRLGSLIEAFINILIGFWINFFANMIILPAFGFDTFTWAINMQIGILYTIVSVIRSYVIRRWFNQMLHRAALRLAGVKS